MFNSQESSKALYDSLCAGSLSQAQRIFEEVQSKRAFDPGFRDEHGITFMHLAVIRGYQPLMAYLEREANDLLNCPDDLGLTPLHYATMKKDRSLKIKKEQSVALYHSLLKSCNTVEWLLDHGATVNAQSNEGYTALDLLQAIQPSELALRSLKTKRKLLDQHQAQSHKSVGNTPFAVPKIKLNTFKWFDLPHIQTEAAKVLYYSLRSNNIPQVQRLFEEAQSKLGFDSGFRDKQGITFMHLAVIRGYLPFMEYLAREEKELLNCPDNLGLTPLHYATMKKDLEINEQNAVLKDDLINSGEAIEWLLDHGATINAKSNEDYTALDLLQAIQPSEGSHSTLIAKRNVLDQHQAQSHKSVGNTPFAVPVLELKEFDEWFDLPQIQKEAAKVLYYSLCRNNIPQVQRLFEETQSKLGFDLRFQAEQGTTLMHLAVIRGYQPLMAYLEREANDLLNCPDDLGLTPLHYATMKKDLEVNEQNAVLKDDLINSGETVEWLLQHGATINAKSNEGYTALDLLQAMQPVTFSNGILIARRNLLDRYDAQSYQPVEHTSFELPELELTEFEWYSIPPIQEESSLASSATSTTPTEGSYRPPGYGEMPNTDSTLRVPLSKEPQQLQGHLEPNSPTANPMSFFFPTAPGEDFVKIESDCADSTDEEADFQTVDLSHSWKSKKTKAENDVTSSKTPTSQSVTSSLHLTDLNTDFDSDDFEDLADTASDLFAQSKPPFRP